MVTAAACIVAAAALDQPLPRELSWQAKVPPRVLTAPAEEEQEILVVLQERADLSGARDLPTKEAKARYVFERLTETAARTQAPLRSELDASGISYQSFWITNMIAVRGRADLVEALARRRDVARIEANAPIRSRLPLPETVIPGAGLGIESIEAVAAGPGSNLVRIGAPDVWAAGFTGQGVVVAGADTGYDWTHPALKGKYRGWNGTTADHNYNWHDAIHSAPGNPCKSDAKAPCDDDGHGTHTMGTMVGDDGAGNQIGVAPGAKWIGCRNMDEGTGTPARYTECFQFFLAPTTLSGANPDPSKAPDVVNNSWDCPPSEGCTNADTLKSIIETLRAAGILVVVAAGNEGPACNSMDVPEQYEASLDVGATDNNDVIQSFSSRGPGQNGSIKPQVMAPGVNIRSSVPGGGYALMSGTSMASPHAAGLAALLLSANPSLSGDPTGLEVLMEQSAVGKTTTDTCGGIAAGAIPNNTAGWGRIDALAAVNAATAPDTPPTVALTSPANGAVFTAPGSIPLVATASDDGVVARVDFYAGGTRIATDVAPPFTATWTGVAPGNYELTAVATDDQGVSTTSAPVSITVASMSPLPPPWFDQDVGSVLKPGSAAAAGGVFTVAGSGQDIWYGSDQFHYAYQALSGDGQITARVTTETDTNVWAKVGVMIRESTDPGSPYAFMLVTPERGVASQHRLAPAINATGPTVSGIAAPVWLRVARSGDDFTASWSSDGASWSVVDTVTIPMAPSVLIGLAVTSHASSLLCTATFDNVSVTSSAPPPTATPTRTPTPAGASPTPTAVPATSTPTPVPATSTPTRTATRTPTRTPTAAPLSWTNKDVGAVLIAGSGSQSGGVFTVKGSGSDIWYASDQFHFYYQGISGDGALVARAASVTDTNVWAKVGVMIRADLTVGSAYAFMLVTPERGIASQHRLAAGTNSAGPTITGIAAPVWIKIERSGNVFTASWSGDGVAWSVVDTVTISMPSNALVGFAVSGHGGGLCTATFDNVAVTP
jgi:subtilisin family serine protease/regulation of enolase protein 1 (concanavalin A-like superfamily)